MDRHAQRANLLCSSAQAMGLNLGSEQVEQLLAFIALIDKWNRTHNLTAITDIDEMLVKHLLDSLSIARFIPTGDILDVGTGAGLPAVPLSIVSTNNTFTLVDSSQKRIGFLKEVKRKLALTNILPVHARVEDFAGGHYAAITSRAFSSLAQMLAQTEHLLADNGSWLAMKGSYPEQEIAELDDRYKVVDSTALQVPGLDAQRYLIQIQHC